MVDLGWAAYGSAFAVFGFQAFEQRLLDVRLDRRVLNLEMAASLARAFLIPVLSKPASSAALNLARTRYLHLSPVVAGKRFGRTCKLGVGGACALRCSFCTIDLAFSFS